MYWVLSAVRIDGQNASAQHNDLPNRHVRTWKFSHPCVFWCLSVTGYSTNESVFVSDGLQYKRVGVCQ